MPLSRAQKEEMIQQTKTALESAGVLVMVHNNGLTVAQVSSLRRKMRDAGASFRVVKNRLAKRAIENTPYAGVEPLLKGPTAMATSPDPVTAAKVTVEFAKNNEKLVIIGGLFGDRLLDAKGVEQLAKMPSLDELRATLIALLQTPATRIAGVLQAPAGQLARVVGAYAKKE
ncbi:MAG: 50S ribosomal protein L10 [Alphaproteobacteria bacterium]|nr:50S ribosomal protein L10 [Alphaproteobacteria bacterium]